MIRFGILGAGNIAHRFAASLAHEGRAELIAASCRSQEKAQAFLGEVPHAHHARAYGAYDEMLDDPKVDAVYLALPHAFHHEWAIRAMCKGKAVLSEKPAMLTASEVDAVADVARQRGVLFMEAMKPRFVPLYSKVLKAVHELGALTRVETTLCNDMLGQVEGTGTYHMTPGPGSGVLLDCGTYCASWLAQFCPDGLEPVSVSGIKRNGVDVYVDARMRSGRIEAKLECAFDRAKPRRATIVGENGYIEVDELHRPTMATVHLVGERSRALGAPYEVDDFFGEIRHFVSLLEEERTESPVMSLEDSLACASILDCIRDAL